MDGYLTNDHHLLISSMFYVSPHLVEYLVDDF